MRLNLQVWQQRLFSEVTDITQITFWTWNPQYCGYFDAIFSISIYKNVHIDSSMNYFYNSFIGNSKNKITTNNILDRFPAPKQERSGQHQIKINSNWRNENERHFIRIVGVLAHFNSVNGKKIVFVSLLILLFVIPFNARFVNRFR